MTDQSTMDRLHVMKLTKMAENYLLQEQDPRIKEMSFDERFALMVDAEYRSRVNNRRARYRKAAQLEQPNARIEEINYDAGRTLNRRRIEQLAKEKPQKLALAFKKETLYYAALWQKIQDIAA